jgi:hypothetical protein
MCRLVRAGDWSSITNSPNAAAFKGIKDEKTNKRGISNWDRTEMAQRDQSIDLLRTGNLQDYPYTTYLKAEDYLRAAERAERELQKPCRVSIRYTPDAVAPEQFRWAYAHVDVIEEVTTETAPKFREILKKRARKIALCETCDRILLRDQVDAQRLCADCR